MESAAHPRAQTRSPRKPCGKFYGGRIPASSSSFLIALLVVILSPSPASAQVVINEVMYNPSGDNSKRQWIELYNVGSNPVVLVAGNKAAAWHVNDGSSHYLVDPASTNNAGGRGSLTLLSGAYAVIASDPETFIEEYPGGSYSVIKSAISPSATQETITLLDETGNTVGSAVLYSSDMGANNDGNSLQLTTNSSWIAAPPTPGAANATTPSEPSNNDTGSSANTDTTTTATSTQTQTTTTTTTVSAPVSSYVSPPEIQIFADGGDDRTVIVGADTEFWGRAYNRGKEELARVRFSWNFGDGSTAEGMTVLHHFDYPGRYAVVLNIAEHRSAASDVIVVEAEPAQLSFGIGADGSVSIENEAGRDLDLSRWVVRSFGREFILPEHSIILKGATTHILQKTLGFPAGLQTELAYPNGVVAFRVGESTAEAAPPVSIAPAAPPVVIPPPVVPVRAVSFSAPPPTEQNTDEQVAEEATSSQVAASAAVIGGSWGWWSGVLALTFASTGAVYLARHYARKEWNIVEETGDAV